MHQAITNPFIFTHKNEKAGTLVFRLFFKYKLATF